MTLNPLRQAQQSRPDCRALCRREGPDLRSLRRKGATFLALHRLRGRGALGTAWREVPRSICAASSCPAVCYTLPQKVRLTTCNRSTVTLGMIFVTIFIDVHSLFMLLARCGQALTCLRQVARQHFGQSNRGACLGARAQAAAQPATRKHPQ